MKTNRTRLAQIEVVPGAPMENTEKILASIEAARADQVDLLVFPELAIPGAMIGDLSGRTSFLRECETCGARVIAASRGITVVFGNVAVEWYHLQADGRPRCFNALFAAEDGQALFPVGANRPYAIQALPLDISSYGVARPFCDAHRLAAIEGFPFSDLIAPVCSSRLGKIGLLVGECVFQDPVPARLLVEKGAEYLVIASASRFAKGKRAERIRTCANLSTRLERPVVYVNAVGVQDAGKAVCVFDGGSAVFDATGARLEAEGLFEESFPTYDISAGSASFGTRRDIPACSMGEVVRGMLHGLRAFMKRLRIRRVVVGVSGGIDSAVTAALYGSILPPEDLLLVGMPGPFTSETTRGLGHRLASNLGARFAEVPIGTSVEETRRQFAELVGEGPGKNEAGEYELGSFAMENVQARDRGSRILAAAASAFGGVISCNANKDEVTVGYGTLYGDILGWLACLGDLWKHEVYGAGRILNDEIFKREIIPDGIFKIRPSAELSAKHAVDKGLGDPLNYPYHDCLFRAWVERPVRVTPEECLEWYLAGNFAEKIGYDGDLGSLFPSPSDFITDLERWWNLYQGLAGAKRMQAPPVLAISSRTYGLDLHEAQLGPRYSSRYQRLRKETLEAK